MVEQGTVSQEYLNQKLWDINTVAQPDILKEWLTKGANPNARMADGRTVLHHYAAYCQTEQMRILMDAGADVNSVSDRTIEMVIERGVTPLMQAAGCVGAPFERQVDALRLLLAAGADINAVSDAGRTALNAAQGFTLPEAARLSMFHTRRPSQIHQAELVAQFLRENGAVD